MRLDAKSQYLGLDRLPLVTVYLVAIGSFVPEFGRISCPVAIVLFSILAYLEQGARRIVAPPSFWRAFAFSMDKLKLNLFLKKRKRSNNLYF